MKRITFPEIMTVPFKIKVCRDGHFIGNVLWNKNGYYFKARQGLRLEIDGRHFAKLRDCTLYLSGE